MDITYLTQLITGWVWVSFKRVGLGRQMSLGWMCHPYKKVGIHVECTCCPMKYGITCFPFSSTRHGGCSSVRNPVVPNGDWWES